MTKEALNLKLDMTKEALQQALKCAKRCEAIDGMHNWGDTITALKKVLAQPQRPWVGLTDEELSLLWLDHHGSKSLADGRILDYERFFQAKLKELNI